MELKISDVQTLVDKIKVGIVNHPDPLYDYVNRLIGMMHDSRYEKCPVLRGEKSYMLQAMYRVAATASMTCESYLQYAVDTLTDAIEVAQHNYDMSRV